MGAPVTRLRVLTSGYSLTASRMTKSSTAWECPDRDLSSKSVPPSLKRATQGLTMLMEMESSSCAMLMF